MHQPTCNRNYRGEEREKEIEKRVDMLSVKKKINMLLTHD